MLNANAKAYATNALYYIQFISHWDFEKLHQKDLLLIQPGLGHQPTFVETIFFDS